MQERDRGHFLFLDGRRDSKKMSPALKKVSHRTSKTDTGNTLLTEKGSLVHETLTSWGSLTRFWCHPTLILGREVGLLKEASRATREQEFPVNPASLVPGLTRGAQHSPVE